PNYRDNGALETLPTALLEPLPNTETFWKPCGTLGAFAALDPTFQGTRRPGGA
ncbi:MAG: hypothetical protein ACI9R3_006245, partial [Verrucomicrobiales bacterium]